MANTLGNQSIKTISGQSRRDIALAIQLLILFAAGFGAVVLHARFRNPIGIPGHHGLEFMALAVTTALFFRFRLRGVVFSLGAGAALFLPFLGFTDPFAEFVFMLPAIILCLLADAIKVSGKAATFVLMALGGLAYMSIPLARLAIHAVTGFPYKSLLVSPFYVVFMHFVFGAAGAFLGYLIYRGLKRS
ncbi:MAG: hypothetical protein AB7V36_07560 [Bacteroidales bacterium]|nr:hypothetical protein [Bacteroidales bacterium]